jgi:hypothetical protein
MKALIYAILIIFLVSSLVIAQTDGTTTGNTGEDVPPTEDPPTEESGDDNTNTDSTDSSGTTDETATNTGTSDDSTNTGTSDSDSTIGTTTSGTTSGTTTSTDTTGNTDTIINDTTDNVNDTSVDVPIDDSSISGVSDTTTDDTEGKVYHEREREQVNETKKFMIISTGIAETFEIDNKEDMGVESIEIKTNKIVIDAEISIRNLEEKPPEVSVPPPAAAITEPVQDSPTPPRTQQREVKVYQYLEINKTNIENNEIEDATITFRVEKAWVINNEINTSTVVLSRFDNESWEDLPTTMAGEEEEDYVYEAVTPGFSVFVVKADISFSDPEPESTCIDEDKECFDSSNTIKECVNNTWIIVEQCDYDCLDDKCIQPNYENLIYVILIASVGVGIFLVWKFRHKFKRTPKGSLPPSMEKTNKLL